MTELVPAPFAWLFGTLLFAVMFALGLMIGRAQVRAAVRRRTVIALALFAVFVAVPALAVAAVRLFGLSGAPAAGILLMAISPGAPVALRRALDAGRGALFAPGLHVSILALAALTVPISLALLSGLYGRAFGVTPMQVARQVLLAQLMPIGLGAALHAWRPALAGSVEARVVRLLNPALLLAAVLLVAVLWSRLVEAGWAPFAAGLGVTACALALGAACVWRDRTARPVAAVAAAMRNPGLALLIASVNAMPLGVAVAALSYALGSALTITAFLVVLERVARARAASG